MRNKSVIYGLLAFVFSLQQAAPEAFAAPVFSLSQKVEETTTSTTTLEESDEQQNPAPSGSPTGVPTEFQMGTDTALVQETPAVTASPAAELPVDTQFVTKPIDDKQIRIEAAKKRAEDEKKPLMDEYLRLQEEVRALENEKANLEAELASLSGQLRDQNSLIREITTKLIEERKILKTREAEIEEAKRTALRENRETAQSDLDSAKAAQKLALQIADSTKATAELVENIKWQTDLAAVNSSTTLTQAQKAAKRKIINDAHAKTVKAIIAAWNSAKKKAETDYNKSKKDIGDELKKKNAEAEKTYADDMAEARAVVKELEKKLLEAYKAADDLKVKIGEASLKLQQVQRELDTKKQRMAELQRQMDAIDQRLEAEIAAIMNEV